MNHTPRLVSTVLFFSIVIMGIFKYWFLGSLSPIVFWCISNLGMELSSFTFLSFDKISLHKLESEKLGYFLYFPIYLSLHVIFAGVLFYNKPKLRNTIMLSIIGVIVSLAAMRVVLSYFEMIYWADIADRFIRKLFALPFLLLAIEGGKILYSDIKKRTDS